MSHVVVVMKIQLERAQKFFGAAMLETRIVVDAGIVNQHVQSAEIAQRSLDNGGTVWRRQQIGGNQATGRASLLKIELQLLSRVAVLVHQDRSSALARTTAGDSSADALSAPGDQNHFALKLQVHVLLTSSHKTERRCRQESFLGLPEGNPSRRFRRVALPDDRSQQADKRANRNRTSSGPGQKHRRARQGTA